jgi:hypothetical protein
MSSRLPLLAGEQLYEAQSDFEGKGKNQLNFRKGDYINIIGKTATPGWLEGELNGKHGLVPARFVKYVPTTN